MKCTKTGCHVFLESYGEYLHGDAFEGEGFALFRIVERSRQPLQPNIHFVVNRDVLWFDKDKAGTTSTLIAYNYRNCGYEGIKVETANLKEGGS